LLLGFGAVMGVATQLDQRGRGDQGQKNDQPGRQEGSQAPPPR
jgi:hypothetical protein